VQTPRPTPRLQAKFGLFSTKKSTMPDKNCTSSQQLALGEKDNNIQETGFARIT